MHHFDPSNEIQDYLVFGEYGDVNPSITDSSTYTFLSPEKMKELFDHEVEGCFLYSRHWNPTNKYLSDALAKLGQEQRLVQRPELAVLARFADRRFRTIHYLGTATGQSVLAFSFLTDQGIECYVHGWLERSTADRPVAGPAAV